MGCKLDGNKFVQGDQVVESVLIFNDVNIN